MIYNSFIFELALHDFDLGYFELLVDAFLEVGDDQLIFMDSDLHNLIQGTYFEHLLAE